MEVIALGGVCRGNTLRPSEPTMNPVQLQIGLTINESTTQALQTIFGPMVEAAFANWARQHSEAVKEEGPFPGRAGKRDPVEASRHALFGGQALPEDLGLLLDYRELSKLMKLSQRTLWRMAHEGEMPAPIKVGRAVRFSYDEIRAWISAGCPHKK